MTPGEPTGSNAGLFAAGDWHMPSWEILFLIPNSTGVFGDSVDERDEEGRGGIWTLRCEPNRTTGFSGLGDFRLGLSSERASAIPLVSNFLSQKELLTLEKGFVSRIEVGLITITSASVCSLGLMAVNSLWELKREEDEEGGLPYPSRSAIRVCLLVAVALALDLFLNIYERETTQSLD